MSNHIVCTHDQFYVKDYERHVENENLWHGLHIYCPTFRDMERVRMRIVGYARVRNHSIYATKLDEKTLYVKIMGRLHLDK